MTDPLYRSLFDLSGKTVALTGGAGFLGGHFARAYAAHGAAVAVLDVKEDAARALADELVESYGVKAVGAVCDISDEASVAAALETVETAFGPCAVIHNNAANQTAGLIDQFAPIEEYRMEDWRRVVDVDLQGAFLVARAFGARMVAHGLPGSIIQTSSIYGSFGSDNRIYEGAVLNGRQICNPAVYSMVKAGSEGLIRWLATYWGDKGVRANAIVPGGVEGGQNEAFKRRYAARTPLNRMARVEDVVGAAVFLASDASAYVTGQSLFVDGGLSAW